MQRVCEWPLTVRLSNGVLLPRVGFGTHQLRGEACTRAVELALRTGYRHIDTASIYKNEAEVRLIASLLQHSSLFCAAYLLQVVVPNVCALFLRRSGGACYSFTRCWRVCASIYSVREQVGHLIFSNLKHSSK